MIKTVFYSLAAANLASMVAGECANACNGHGKCTSYDMCTCNRNWQANDCSERVCQFGLAHVDTPKGDLNHDGVIGDPTQTVAVNSFTYPYGTTEQFPRMQDSDLMNLDESAHYYMECSNKGTCNRDTGDCECFDGYDGAACQRASCPGFPDSCSGHGVCKTIRQLADADNGNIYELWDKHSTMGCECDAGFFGPDCSQRKCKYGVDPLYLDDSATIKYSTFNFGIVSRYAAAGVTSQIQGGSPTDGVSTSDNDGHFAIRFFDMHGEDWLTGPIKYGAECSDVIAALNALPNNVIPEMDDSFCTKIAVGPDTQETLTKGSDWNKGKDTYFHSNQERSIYLPMAFWTKDLTNDASRRTYLDKDDTADTPLDVAVFAAAGTVYQIHFFNNPGAFREPEIEIFLDGSRPSITDANSDGSLFTRVWTDGQQGETVDYVADHCDGVTFTLQYENVADDDVVLEGPRDIYLAGLDDAEVELLKACLGPSDFDDNNNVDIHEWDYGTEKHPHFVKIVRSVTTYNDGGYYAALIWHDSKFKLFNNLLTSDEDSTAFLRPDGTNTADTDVYEIYTTKGTLALSAEDAEVVFGFASREIIMGNMKADKTVAGYFSGDLSCEGVELYPDVNGEEVEYCLNKGDLFTVFASKENNRASNPSHLNLYTAEKLYKKQANLIVDDYSDNVAYDDDGAPVNLKKMYHLEYGTHTIVTDLSTNWAHADIDRAQFRVYKFFPSDESKYEYVAQCSNRGICDESSGVCKCFGGYTGDDCSEQNSLAV